jgi:hypothetical protein
VSEIIKSLTKEFEDIIRELGLKFMSYRRGGRLVLKIFTPNDGWYDFVNPHWFHDAPKEKMVLFLQQQLREELRRRLKWKIGAYGRLQGDYISVGIYVTTKKTIIVDFYPPQSEKPVATVRMEKLDLQQLEQLLRQVDAWGVL